MVFSEGDVKWIPIRVRKDKLTPNHFDVASNIWKIYFNPVSQDILKGEKFTIDNLSVKRPGGGIPSLFYNRYIGKIANKNIQADTLIKKSDVKSKSNA